jgi:pimeloyl-ACP methyl ester carboxylesterase
MQLQVNGAATYCYTGGKPFACGQPTVVFIHGVLNDHSVWILQTRYFAHHGWNVLAVDLPGHCKSAGEPPRSVQEGADFILALLAAAGVEQAALVGHSFGSLIALEAAALAPARVSRLVLAGTAAPMKVSPALLETSVNAPLQAIDMVNRYSHSLLAPPPSALGPGSWLYGGSRALMRRVLAGNPRVNLLHRGFVACDSYAGGEQAMAQVPCPTLFLLGRNDAMTPPKAAQPLQAGARDGRTVLVDGGHQMMTEAPDPVLFALKGFLQA